MHKYLLFGGDNYYPAGGWDDFKGSFHTLKAAYEAAKEVGVGKKAYKYDWWHIIDRDTEQKFDRP